MSVIKIGQVFKTNGGVDCVVIDYENFTNVTVRFLDEHGFTTKITARNLRYGEVKNLYCPSVLGIGYIGCGEYPQTEGGKLTKIYRDWYNMIKRAYCPKLHDFAPTYIGCTVHPDWHNFQVFAKWYSDNPYSDLGYQLDKDILVRGNKVYSPETCCFVPRELNSLFCNSARTRGGYPVGVSYRKNSGKFFVRLKYFGVEKSLGYYKTPEEASAAYVVAKEAYVKEVALEWKDKIEPRAFEALMNWTVY